jgi:hypothetical protein
MEHLGHTNIQTTINTYGHLFPNVRERIRVALEDTWDEGHRSAGCDSRGLPAAWAPGAPASRAGTPPLTWAFLVELRGFEPLTPCMPCKCSAS